MNGARQVTLSDVADHVGVSVATVSQALSGKGRLAEATRQRILLAVEALAYHPDEAAKSLANRRASELSDDDSPPPARRRKRRMPAQILFDVLDVAELKNLVAMEIQQCDEEGYNVEPWRDALETRTRWSKNQLSDLYTDLVASSLRADYPYDEPLGLNEIRATRPVGPRRARLVLTPASLYESLHGAWLGRCAGCVLGKPIESGWPKSKVSDYLRLADAYPLTDYIPRLVPLPATYDMNPESAGFFRGEIDGVPCDDDLDYTVLGLHILESHGFAFTTAQVASEWLGHLPYFRVYTAERIAYRNLTLNIMPPDTALTLNPARELVGARIRADIYGFVSPGKPELAAELAYRDAVLSHTKNGVYSAMFVAAMIAWAFVTRDAREVIEVGLSEIPARCRLAEAVRSAMALRQEEDDWESAYECLMLQLGSYHPVHAINNTVWMVLALLYAEGDFDQAICKAVMCGLDTDCNGANVGSIVGIQHGASGIADKWTVPLRDTLYTTVAQWRERRISALAQRSAQLATRALSTN